MRQAGNGTAKTRRSRQWADSLQEHGFRGSSVGSLAVQLLLCSLNFFYVSPLVPRR